MPYAPLADLAVYHEVHGEGEPLVLLHGGMLTLDLCFGDLLPVLARHRRVVAVELQGHGRTADIDRAPTLGALAGDVVGVLDHLGLERADVLGFSLGGLVALELAVRHPDRVDRLVVAAAHVRADGYHEEIRDPARHATSTRMPTEADFVAMSTEYARLAPPGSSFETVMEKLGPVVGEDEPWRREELAAITAPTLVMVGDHDFVRVEHAELMASLLPDAQLAVLPGTTHMELMRRVAIVAPLLETFLARSGVAVA